MKILVADRETIRGRIRLLLEKELSAVISARGSAVLALPGGRSVVPVIESLPEVAVFWEQIRIFLADERWVARTHPDSNYRLLKEAVDSAFSSQAGPRGTPRLVGLPKVARAAEAAKAYEGLLRESRGAAGGFDVTILGVGEDGHIASIFPGAPLNLQDPPGFTAVTTAPKPPATRVTANASLVTSSPCVIGLFFGEGKADAFRRLTAGESAATLPAALIREAARGYIFADYEAAGGLHPNEEAGASNTN